MKKAILIGMALAGLAVSVGAQADSAEANAGEYAAGKRCQEDGYSYVYKMGASKGLSCAGAYRVMEKWLYNGWLEDTSRHRVGRDGVLWKCNSWREYGKLNPYHVYCWSSQKTWHYSKYGSWYSTNSTWFTYRD
jgi:hypothetical protein